MLGPPGAARVPAAVAGLAERGGAVVVAHPDAGMDVEARVGPPRHPHGLILVEEAAAHEEPQHGAAEGLAEGGAVVSGPARPAHEGAIGPEANVGHEEMGMADGQGALGLERGSDPDAEVVLLGAGAAAGVDDARGHWRQIAQEGPGSRGGAAWGS